MSSPSLNIKVNLLLGSLEFFITSHRGSFLLFIIFIPLRINSLDYKRLSIGKIRLLPILCYTSIIFSFARFSLSPESTVLIICATFITLSFKSSSLLISSLKFPHNIKNCSNKIAYLSKYYFKCN